MDRRRFLGMAAGGALTALAGPAGFTAKGVAAEPGTATISGVVHAGGRGIAGVLVSDGRSVVKTEAAGRYALSVDAERRLTDMVFVSLPEGYRVPLDRVGTPRFFARFDGLAAGDARRQDFGLIPAPALRGGAGEFVHLTDVHVSGNYGTGMDYERERFRDQVRQLDALAGEQDFVMLSGDLSDAATADEYDNFQDAIAGTRHTVWTSAGNHDLDFSAPGGYAAEIERFRVYEVPEWYSFDYRGFHVVVMEDYRAVDDDEQFEWLQRDLELARSRHGLIVIAHVAMNDPLTIRGTERYVELLRGHRVRLALTGHTHRNDVDPTVFEGGVHVVTEPGWAPQDGGPVGFRRVTVTGGRIRLRFKAFDVEQALTIAGPGPVAPSDRRLELLVNAYDTTAEVTAAQYRVDRDAWHRLARDGTWSWASDLRPLSPGRHTIEARVTDEKGRTWSVDGAVDAVAPETLAAPRAGADWPTFLGGPTHTGAARDTVAPPLRLAWTYRTGGTILASSPAVADGIAYIGVKDDDGVERNGIVALDAASGRELWRARTDAPVDGTPSVAGGVLYVSSIRGTVHALDARTGAPRWERRYGTGSDGVQRWWGYACPIVAGGLVYQSFGFVLVALDAASGQERWRFAGGGANSYHGMPALSEDGATVYFPSKGDAIWALHGATGSQLWRKNPVDGLYRSTPAVASGVVYARTGDMVLALDGRTGAEVRRFTGLGHTLNAESPAVGDGRLISPGNARVDAFDAASGARLWSRRLGGRVESSPALSGDTAYVGSHDGQLYALDVRTGDVRWRHAIGTWVKSSPAVTGNLVLVGASDGNVYAFAQVAG